MSFTSPWLLWALFAASIPIIIHLVNRWRHRSVHWAAMEFLLRAARETRGTKKLLHYLILALRVLAVAALVTAFARPLLSSFFGWGSSGLNEVLLVLDRSASMDARPDKTNSLRTPSRRWWNPPLRSLATAACPCLIPPPEPSPRFPPRKPWRT